jgi:hypothetical protein
VLSVGGGLFSRGYAVQPPRYGATEADFRDLLARADYSRARGFTKDQILKHGVFESVGDGKYLVRVGPGYVHGDDGKTFVLDLGQVAQQRAMGGAMVGAMGAPAKEY